MRPAPEISAIRSSGLRAVAVVALAAMLLVSPALAGLGAARPAPIEATTGSRADRPATTVQVEGATSTSRPPAGRASASWSPMLPLVLAAIVLLALLDPPSGFHSHRHWHRY